MTKEEIWKVSGINSDLLVSNLGRVATIKKGGDKLYFKGSYYNTQCLIADAFPELFFTDSRSDYVSLDGEEWRPIPDAEDYEISNKGRVRRLVKTSTSIYYTPIKTTYAGARGRKYARVIIRNGSIRYYIGKLVYSVFVGDVPPRSKIEYVDGDMSNNSLENLRLVSFDDFFGEMKNGHVEWGKAHRKEILNKGHAMMKMREEGKTIKEIADIFGVARNTVYNYIRYARPNFKH